MAKDSKRSGAASGAAGANGDTAAKGKEQEEGTTGDAAASSTGYKVSLWKIIKYGLSLFLLSLSTYLSVSLSLAVFLFPNVMDSLSVFDFFFCFLFVFSFGSRLVLLAGHPWVLLWAFLAAACKQILFVLV